MNNTINLTMNPHYGKTFRFYYLALLGLFACGCYLIQNSVMIQSRWDNQSIIAVHFFTLGFLLPIFMGSISQLLPVLFGIENQQVKILDKVLLILPVASGALLYFFHHNQLDKNYLLVFLMISFWSSLLRSAFSILKSTLEKYRESKKSMYLHLLIAQVYFVLGIAASIWLMAIHFGVPLPYFRPHVTDIHLSLFLLGFFYHLFVAISQHIVPMFFITAATPEGILKRQLIIPLLLFGYFLSWEWEIAHGLFKFIIFYFIGEYLLQLYWSLKNRRRKNKDPVIFLWNLFFVQTILGLLLWNLMPFFKLNQEAWELRFGGVIFFGIFLGIILAMMVKIIPFLLWQSLSQKQMESMNFNTTLPNLKDFISDKKIKMIFYLIILLSASTLFLFHFLSGFILIAISLYTAHLLIHSLQLYQNTLIALNDQTERQE